ncbi:cell division protein FtsQ/DivIB [Limosilactobacillus secaliphilus]|uniref:Cell division protein DivIB n=1 Tax=Limosilactobacillus secaliphilus TaxID=396268 RepID=A0A0R2I0L4_9LACO|nr:FtsQ-type POTRA domain-containing protein [Limosilactobacillus secaliphilus]KRN58688.1 cell division protein FtsQ [Limosilactobacillus secaliphilus]
MSDDRSGHKEHERYVQRLHQLEQPELSADDVEREDALQQTLPKLTAKQIQGNRRRFISVIIPFAVILLIALYIISPLNKVKTVTVTGNHDLSSREIQQITNIKPGRYIYNVVKEPNAALKRGQQKNPQLKDVKIERTGWRSVKVTVSEYPVIGVINRQGKQQVLLGNGKYRSPDGPLTNFVTYSNFEKSPVHLKITAEEIGTLPEAIRHSISDASFAPTKLNPDRIRLLMNDGNTVYVTADQLGKKMKYYPQIVTKMQGNGVIDLQYGAYSYGYGDKSK